MFVKSGLKNLCVLFALFFISATVIAGCSKPMDTSYMNKEGDPSAQKNFFNPTEDDIIEDEETGLRIVKDVINVNFSPKTDEESIKKIIASVNGKIVGYDKTVNLYQIRFPGANLETIDKIRMKLLGEHKEVEMASRCSVSAHKNPYYVK